MKTLYLSLGLVLLAANLFAQKALYVSGASTIEDGTAAHPYKTIIKAVVLANPYDTVYVLPGTYYEADHIYINKPLNLLSKGTVIIDGSSRDTTHNLEIIAVVNTSDVTISGFTIQNFICNGAKGIWVLAETGYPQQSNNIVISNCTVTNIGWVKSSNLSLRSDSSKATNAIKVEGRTSNAITGVKIHKNTVYNCSTGWGEGITVTGNVRDFLVDSNRVYNISNIGIDVAGNYSSTNAPANVNQAFHGTVAGNVVYNCMSPNAVAAGIYLDGSAQITVSSNTVFTCGIGISVGAEVAITSDMPQSGWHSIYNNHVYGNSIKGIVLGAGTKNVNKPVTNVTVYNNTFYKNATAMPVNGITIIDNQTLAEHSTLSAGEVMLQNINSLTLQNNIIYPIEGKKGLNALWGYNITNFTSNYNDYYRDDAAPFFEVGSGVIGFNGSRKDSGDYNTPQEFFNQTTLERNSVNVNPRFADAVNGNFSLTGNSKGVVNKGYPTYNSALSGNVDFAGKARVFDNIIDIGADEYQSLAVAIAPINPLNVFSNSGHVTITWQYKRNDGANTLFTVERSANGKDFAPIESLPFTGDTYTVQDIQPLTGWNYYRIKATQHGAALYSVVKGINVTGTNAVAIYPNPAANGSFNVVTHGLALSNNFYTLYNMQGIPLKRGALAQAVQPVYVQGLAAGSYILKLATGQVVKVIVP